MRRKQFTIAACSFMLQAFLISTYGQAAGKTDSAADSASVHQKKSAHSLYAGAGFGNNMVYLGTTMSQDHSFGYTSMTYGFRDKLYFSAAGYSISGFNPFIAFSSLGLNYSHTFNSWFDISLALSRYSVAEKLRDTLFSNFTYSDATLGFDWRILYTKISLGGLFADEGQFYLQTRHSRYFETPSFARDKAFFSFDPYFNMIFGKIVTVETTEGSSTVVSPGYKPWQRRWHGSYTSFSEKFGLMEIDFGIPVAFSYDFFTLEAEPGYILPMCSDCSVAGMKGFLVTLSAFFRIF